MNWVQILTESIDYIEEHLQDRISIKEISKQANTSIYHYQRMFHMITGMTVAEYIRNRRLSKAAGELISTEKRIIDIGMEYGYESSEAFSRAFKKLHGHNPSEIRKGKGNIKAYPRVTIQLIVEGDEPMDYKIVRKSAFNIMGIKRRIENVQSGENFKTIPVFWQEVMGDGSMEKLMANAVDDKCIGACLPMEADKEDEFDYVIGVFSTNKNDNFFNYEVPEADWAVFEIKGKVPEKLQEAWHRIFAEWFPATGFKHANLPELEVYGDGDTSSDDYLTEIWIPIIKE